MVLLAMQTAKSQLYSVPTATACKYRIGDRGGFGDGCKLQEGPRGDGPHYFPNKGINKPLGYCSVAMTGISNTRAACICGNNRASYASTTIMLASPFVELRL